MNPNLLEYTSVPISIEISVVRGQLHNPKAPKPQMRLTTGEGGIKIQAEPAQINIDSYAARSSMGMGNYNSRDFIKNEANKGINLAYQGTARIVSEGNALARGTTPGQLAMKNSRVGVSIQTIMEHIPKESAEVTFEKGILNINYEMKDVNINWDNLKTVPLEFIPGRVEVNVARMPQIIIEYKGRPIYVPPSADPLYDGRV
jgi:hypothetical protein